MKNVLKKFFHSCLCITLVLSTASLASAQCVLELPGVTAQGATDSGNQYDANAAAIFVIGQFGNKVTVVVNGTGMTVNGSPRLRLFFNDAVVASNLSDYITCEAEELFPGSTASYIHSTSVYIVAQGSYGATAPPTTSAAVTGLAKFCLTTIAN